MINLTRLLCGQLSAGDALRYERGREKPVVVWNTTRRCNLRCRHCYAAAGDEASPGELSTREARALVRELQAFGVPVLLFSGGEPLLRADLFELGALAKESGMRAVISTNGTLIDAAAARAIRRAGFDYVGVSLDGIGEENDRFRGVAGAYEQALAGIRHLRAAGQRAGLRFTLTRGNLHALPAVLELIEKEGIERACFYHLVYTGRGSGMMADDLTHRQARAALDLLCAWVHSLHRRGLRREILTVDNHADGVYLYRFLAREDPVRAAEVLRLLKANGGNGSGRYIAGIDENGEVHPDQFLRAVSFGNIRARPFGAIWTDGGNDVLRRFRERGLHLKGRCGSCRYLELCNGNFRARAYAACGDLWQEDPACYLTDEEIRDHEQPTTPAAAAQAEQRPAGPCA